MTAIYKRDLRSFFISPIGYVFIAAFTVIMNGAFYVLNMLTGENNLITCYTVMLYVLMVLVPILTMRSFSEEYRQKTDQLLLTSPVRPAGIVLGKFLSAYTVFLISLALTVIQVFIISVFGKVNSAIVFGNYIALMSVAAVYIAIGVFISSLTENQLVANIATLAVNVALFLFDMSYDLISLTWIKRIIYWLSLYRRYNTFYMGVFSVADLFYYISAAAVFIFLTVRVMEKKRWN
ncbi:MAG: ABC transporter permease subunit [Oscillospiraceae bacterium]|jgi:ABC-2 type transport system permease protein|nr:ABC transporter permease subunit [Oscillospiraceae bacterium]